MAKCQRWCHDIHQYGVCAGFAIIINNVYERSEMMFIICVQYCGINVGGEGAKAGDVQPARECFKELMMMMMMMVMVFMMMAGKTIFQRSDERVVVLKTW